MGYSVDAKSERMEWLPRCVMLIGYSMHRGWADADGTRTSARSGSAHVGCGVERHGMGGTDDSQPVGRSGKRTVCRLMYILDGMCSGGPFESGRHACTIGRETRIVNDSGVPASLEGLPSLQRGSETRSGQCWRGRGRATGASTYLTLRVGERRRVFGVVRGLEWRGLRVGRFGAGRGRAVTDLYLLTADRQRNAPAHALIRTRRSGRAIALGMAIGRADIRSRR